MQNKSLHDLKVLPYNLRSIRKQKGLSQIEVAKALEIPPNTYNGYEMGNRTPDIYTLKRISNYLGTTIDSLLEYDIDCFIKSKLLLKELLELIVKIDDFCYNLKSEKGRPIKCSRCAFARYLGITNSNCILVQIQNDGLLEDIIATCEYRQIDYKPYIDKLTIFNNLQDEEDLSDE